MSILVTGGLGYIGSHTVVELLNADYEVIVVDNLANSYLWVKDRIEEITGKEFKFYQCDILDTQMLNSIFENHSISGVIHFAADKAVGESVEQPSKYYLNNLGGLASLLSCVEKNGLPSFVFSSSCTVYGDAKSSPLTEDYPMVEAISPYGTTKIIGEQILNDFSKHKKCSIVALRYFNPVGAHESARIGELPLGIPSNLVPFITQTAIGIRKELTVFGGDYNTPDGTCIRDYIHVTDVARAHVKAIEFADKQGEGMEVFNLGTGKGSSVLEVINTFEKSNGTNVNYTIGERRPGDVEQVWASTEKSNQKLNWSTEYNLSDMMVTAWRWQKAISELE